MADLVARKALAHIRYVPAVLPRAAQGTVARVYAQVQRDFGMLAPPVALHAPAPVPLAACWLILRETTLAPGLVGRAAKETVATAVSVANTCPYCVEVHSTTLRGLARGRDAAAVAGGKAGSVTDPALRRIAEWATAGTLRQSAAHAPPVPDGQIPELVGVAVAFHYLNRMVNVFLSESPMPAGTPAVVRAGMRRVLARLMRRIANRTREPGTSLDLLPAAPLPADLDWAAGNPTVAGALARAAAAIDATTVVPQPVRDLMAVRLAEWDGQPPGLGRAWATDAVAELPATDRAAGRLALLTALASYQVDAGVVEEFRRTRRDDRSLIELTAWASLAAARTAASWLPGVRSGGVHGHR